MMAVAVAQTYTLRRDYGDGDDGTYYSVIVAMALAVITTITIYSHSTDRCTTNHTTAMTLAVKAHHSMNGYGGSHSGSDNDRKYITYRDRWMCMRMYVCVYACMRVL